MQRARRLRLPLVRSRSCPATGSRVPIGVLGVRSPTVDRSRLGRNRARQAAGCAEGTAGRCCPACDPLPWRRDDGGGARACAAPSSAAPARRRSGSARRRARALHGAPRPGCGGRHRRVSRFRERSLRGAKVLPKRRASSRSSVSVTARSMTAARLPSGSSVAQERRRRSSLSRSSRAGGELDLEAGRRERFDEGCPGRRGESRDGPVESSRAASKLVARRVRGVSDRRSAPRLVPGRVRRPKEERRRDRDERRALSLLRELPDHEGTSGRGASSATRCFDLARGEVRGTLEERRAVVRGQKRHEPREATQVEPAVPERLQDLRVLARRAGNGDAAVGLGFREMQALGAVGEHRREGLTGEEPCARRLLQCARRRRPRRGATVTRARRVA